TRSAWVCCSITSLTSTSQGSRVVRHGRSRRWAAPHRKMVRAKPASSRASGPPVLAGSAGVAAAGAITPGAAGGRSGVPDVVGIRPAAGRGGGGLPDHHLAAEVADLLAALVERLGLHGDDPPVVA